MMEEKKVFLTGGTGGLGIPVVNELLKEGWKVCASVHSEKSGTTLQHHFPEKYGKQLFVMEGDVTVEADVIKMVKEAGDIDALVHLAGGFRGAENLEDNKSDDFNYLFSLNALSAFLLLKHILPGMKQRQKGHVVMMGAKPALYPTGTNAVYAASKAALTNLVLSVAEEGRPRNVQANVIVPAIIDTVENRKWANGAKTEKWTSPEEIAQTIAWLISENGTSVTGTVIPMFHKISAF